MRLQPHKQLLPTSTTSHECDDKPQHRMNDDPNKQGTKMDPTWTPAPITQLQARCNALPQMSITLMQTNI